MMVLSRADEETKLLVKGREFEEREYDLAFNGGNWELADEETVRERAIRTLPIAVKRVTDLMGACDSWSGTCKELLETISVPDITERALSQQLRDNVDALGEVGISIAWRRTNRGTVVSLGRAQDAAGGDGVAVSPLPGESSDRHSVTGEGSR